MADIFQKLGASLKTTLKAATEQTQKSVDQTVYRTELLSKKNDLKNLYQQLGKQVYEEAQVDEQYVVDELFYTRITALLKEIDVLEDKIKDIVNTQKDSFDAYKREVKTAWSEEMQEQSKPDTDEDGVQIMKICENCQVGNHVEATYCINCGEKF